MSAVWANSNALFILSVRLSTSVCLVAVGLFVYNSLRSPGYVSVS